MDIKTIYKKLNKLHKPDIVRDPRIEGETVYYQVLRKDDSRVSKSVKITEL